jgi:hypothetical protein
MSAHLTTSSSLLDAARSAIGLWDTVVGLVERLAPDDWSRPTPERDVDVRGLVVHLTTTGIPHPRGTSSETLVAQLADARDAQARRLLDLATAATAAERAGDVHSRERRLLGASCVDMLVHTHDLAAATGAEMDLEDTPATVEACRYLLPMASQLMCGATGPTDPSGVRLEVIGLGTVPPSSTGVDDRDVVTTTPAALVLLLSARADVDGWRRRGLLSWTGPHGAAFVRQARLLA